MLIALALGIALSLTGWISAGTALLVGMALSLSIGNPWPAKTRGFAHFLLTAAVVGLGAGADLLVVLRVGSHGLLYTAVGIGFALSFGTWLGRRLAVDRDTGLLVSVGTAICGGSAIAAVAPAIKAKDDAISMSLVTVFLLNALALLIFPPIGHLAHLSQDAFGLWCALAIHDTSSVVGAAAQYGSRALEVATAAKLARALWIVPVTFLIAWTRSRGSREQGARVKLPWFIVGFLGMAALVTFVPVFKAPGHLVAEGARRVLTLTLLLIGFGFTRQALRELGLRAFVLAGSLWLLLASATLGALSWGWIS